MTEEGFVSCPPQSLPWCLLAPRVGISGTLPVGNFNNMRP
jgi:hypothetical protein